MVEKMISSKHHRKYLEPSKWFSQTIKKMQSEIMLKSEVMIGERAVYI